MDRAQHSTECEGGAAPSIRRGPVMADVGRLAGVSYQTVWRGINGHPRVRQETRERVRTAIAQLGYQPNRAAQELATGRRLVTARSPVIGVIVPDPPLLGPASMVTAVVRAAARAGVGLEVSGVPTSDPPSITGVAERLLDRGVAGMVLLTPAGNCGAAVQDLVADVPLITLDGDPSRPDSLVTVDQAAGAAAATRHLLA